MRARDRRRIRALALALAELCAGMIERGHHERLTWSCQTHVNTIDAALARLMRAAGCDWVGLGIETADEAAMSELGKGINRDRVMRAVAAMRAAKLRFHAFFILGQPAPAPPGAAAVATEGADARAPVVVGADPSDRHGGPHAPPRPALSAAAGC